MRTTIGYGPTRRPGSHNGTWPAQTAGRGVTMSAGAGLGKLKHAAKELRLLCEETRATWHDENSRQFEEEVMIPLLARLQRVELNLAHMGAVLQTMHRDCE
jgi:hypothetical protein